MKHKLQTLLKHKLQWLALLVALLGVSQGVWATIYFDTSETGWSSVNLVQGHGSYSCFNTGMTKVNGTYLYKKDSPSWWSDETQFAFSNTSWGCEGNSISHRMGWIGNNNCTFTYDGKWTDGKIYTTNGTATCTSCGNGGSVKAYSWGSTKDYSTTYTVTVSVTGGGTITFKYDNTSGTEQTKTATTSGLLYTTILKSIVATPNTGYTLTSLTVDGNSFTSGNSYTLKKSVTIAATFTSSCTAPTPTTADTPSAYSYTTATLTGTYPTTSSYCAVTAKGICYGTSANPTTKYADTTSGSGSISYSATGLNDNTTYHYRAYVVSGGTTYYGADKSFTTTACSAPTISTQPSTSSRTYCKGATATTLTVTATGGVGSYTYQWQQSSSASGTYSDVTTGTGYNTASFTPSTADAGTTYKNKYYKCIVTNSGVCTSNSVTSDASGRYRTYATSVAGSISDAGTFCQGESGDTQTLTLSGNTGSTIKWYGSPTSGFTPSASTLIDGATSTTYNAPISSTGTMYYKATVQNSTACSTVTTAQATMTVDPYPTITAQPTASQTVCSGSTPTSISVTATGTGLSYQWQIKTTGDWGDMSNRTSSTLTWDSPVTIAGTWYYRCKITASCGATIYSDTHTLTGVANASIASVTLTSSSVCKGQGLSATANSVVLGGGTGAWSSSNTSVATVNSGGTIATPGAGTANIIYTITGGCGGTKSAQASLKVKATATAAQYTLTNNAQTYNGSARAVTVTPASGAGAATVYYTGTGSTTYAKSTTAPTNAGSYSITIDAAAGDDYCAATNLSLGTDSIKKATQSTLTISNSVTSLVYCDDASVTLTTSGGSGGGAVTYAVTSGSGSVDGDVLSPSARGSVTVVADKAASANYKGIKSAAKTFNFNVDAPTVYTLSNVGGATTICGDPSTGAGSGTLRLANSQTGYNYQLYSNGSPVEGYAAKAGTTGSSIDFPVTSSGTYTVYAYYGTNSSNCATQMDGEITLTISTQPKLVRSAASVTEYMPVTITSVSTDIAEWKIVDGSGNDVSSSTAYLFDQTYDAITFKGASTDASTPKTYTIKATTAGGCSETTTVTVNPDTESCS